MPGIIAKYRSKRLTSVDGFKTIVMQNFGIAEDAHAVSGHAIQPAANGRLEHDKQPMEFIIRKAGRQCAVFMESYRRG